MKKNYRNLFSLRERLQLTEYTSIGADPYMCLLYLLKIIILLSIFENVINCLKLKLKQNRNRNALFIKQSQSDDIITERATLFLIPIVSIRKHQQKKSTRTENIEINYNGLTLIQQYQLKINKAFECKKRNKQKQAITYISSSSLFFQSRCV